MKALIDKAKNFIKERKKQIKGFAVVFLIVLAISLVTYFILLGTGVLVHGEEGIEFDVTLFDAYKNKWYGGLIIMLLQTVLTMLLCFIPGISMAFIMLINQLYGGDPMSAFGISFASVMLSSSVLYILGRFGGYRLCEKLLGEEDTEKALGLLRDNGTVYFPLMMMFPVFPDDALTMVAGTIRMRLVWFIPSIVIGRGVGTASIIFGMAELLPKKESPSYAYDWFVLAAMIAFLLVSILYLANSLNKMMAEKREGTYKPFKLRDMKPEDWFAMISTVATGIVGISIFSNPRLLPSMGTFYIWFELLVVMIFYLLLAFLVTRAVYRSYKRYEKHGKIRARRVRPTAATLAPSLTALGALTLFTVIASLVGFFPDIVLPYDWIVVLATYIIWAIAIYVLTSKVMNRVRKALNKKKKAKEQA